MKAAVIAIAVLVPVGAVGCAGDGAEVTTTSPGPDQTLLDRCGSRGAPVTLATLIEVARANGVTLDVDRRGCERPASDPNLPDATNAGPSGLKPAPGVFLAEGHVLCDVAVTPGAANRDVEVIKYPTDRETQVGVLNVGCAVYPSSAETEQRQVDRVRRALQALTSM